MALGDRMLYKATYTNKRGTLPYGTEIQFISERYKAEYFLFNGEIIPSNFEKEIVSACMNQYGIDVTNDFRFDAGGRAFQIECITARQKYPKKEMVSSIDTTQSEEMGCLSSLKQLFWRIVKYFFWSIILVMIIIVLVLIFG